MTTQSWFRRTPISATVWLGAFFFLGCGAHAAERQHDAQRDLYVSEGGVEEGATDTTAPDGRDATTNFFVASAQKKFMVKIDWISGAPQSGDLASARLTFLTAGEKMPGNIGEVTAKVFMPAHTHPPMQVQVTRTEALPVNAVDVAGIKISMSGQWQMDVQAVVDGQQDSAKLLYEVP